MKSAKTRRDFEKRLLRAWRNERRAPFRAEATRPQAILPQVTPLLFQHLPGNPHSPQLKNIITLLFINNLFTISLEKYQKLNFYLENPILPRQAPYPLLLRHFQLML